MAVPVPRARLGEGPRWDADTGTLLWVDIPAGLVHRLDPAGDEQETIDVGRPVGVAAPRVPGGPAPAVRDGFAVPNRPRGTSVQRLTPSRCPPGAGVIP
ncbi:SMP-30/gluconolactonase/LRE family protein [Nonomuraea sp. NPDC050451]|uniref:SMP-30/gluconolactonase/LRE family protein n=1 Tax=Nonomuraea sp. NPDC050451 TaxID=3364364 RepID=UPI0037A1EC45